MADVSLLTTEQRASWNLAVKDAGGDDIYFTAEYAASWEQPGAGLSRLFVWRGEEGVLAYPFKLRDIGDVAGLESFRGWQDIISDYGYGGPIMRASQTGQEKIVAEKALSAFEDVLRELRVVTEFCRYHPLYDNAALMPEWRAAQTISETAVADLTLSPEEYARVLRRGHRRDIVKCEEEGATVEMAPAIDHVDEFHRLYTETMLARNASAFYLFSPDFIARQFELLGERVKMMRGFYKGKVVAVRALMCGDRFLHDHLSGSASEFRKLALDKLILHRTIQWGHANGYARFQLGGGLGGQHDHIMDFKTGFTPLRGSYAISKRVVNPALYRDLCAKVQADETGAFFPAYRQPARPVPENGGQA